MMCNTGSNYAGFHFYEWLDLFPKKKKKKREELYTGTAGRAPRCLGTLTQNVTMLGRRKISSANPWNSFEVKLFLLSQLQLSLHEG